MIRVAVSGAAGRMGATVCQAVEGAEDMELTGRADPRPLATLAVAYRAAGREAEAEAALGRAAELRGATE